MPSFLWEGNLPNGASKIKQLLAHHDIHLPQANVSYTSPLFLDSKKLEVFPSCLVYRVHFFCELSDGIVYFC
jgi:hypothetical protein